MRDEDDIVADINVYFNILKRAKEELDNAIDNVNLYKWKLGELNKELTEWQFTHGEKVYEPKREVDEEE